MQSLAHNFFDWLIIAIFKVELNFSPWNIAIDSEDLSFEKVWKFTFAVNFDLDICNCGYWKLVQLERDIASDIWGLRGII